MTVHRAVSLAGSTVGFWSVWKVSDEIAVTSAPVSSLKVMLCLFTSMVAYHAELWSDVTVSRNAASSWLLLTPVPVTSETLLEKHCDTHSVPSFTLMANRVFRRTLVSGM